jgi:hypothetical protein
LLSSASRRFERRTTNESIEGKTGGLKQT